MKTTQIYCDFECSTQSWDSEKSYVWLWGALEKTSNFFEYGIDMESYFEYLNNLNESAVIWFHNGGTYDFEFIKHHLGKHYLYKQDKISLKKFEFSLVVRNEHDTYGIVFVNRNNKRIYFRDSYKHVEVALGNDVDSTKISKETEYYHKVRSYKTKDDVNDEDKEYMYNDCVSLKRIMEKFEITNKINLNKYTKTSYAWAEFKKEIKYTKLYEDKITKKEWDIFRTYNTGGFVWINDTYQGKLLKGLTRDDVNSLYPATMYYTPMPIGSPIYGCRIDCEHVCSLLEIKITCKIKEGCVPFIRVGNSFREEHIVWQDIVNKETIKVTKHMLTKIFEYYDVYDYKLINMICFEHTMGVGHTFFDKYMDIKIKCEKDSPEYDDAKVKMNSCWGRCCMTIYNEEYFMRPLKKGEKLRKDKSIYGNYVMDKREVVSEKIPYNPLAVFVLSNSKSYYLIDMIQKIGRDNVIYVDTDSITYWSKLNGINPDIHQTELGKWKKEFEHMNYGLYLKRKFYLLSSTLDQPVDQIKSSKIKKANIKKYSLNDWIEKNVSLVQTRKMGVDGGIIIIEKEQFIKGYNDKENVEWKIDTCA